MYILQISAQAPPYRSHRGPTFPGKHTGKPVAAYLGKPGMPRRGVFLGWGWGRFGVFFSRYQQFQPFKN